MIECTPKSSGCPCLQLSSSNAEETKKTRVQKSRAVGFNCHRSNYFGADFTKTPRKLELPKYLDSGCNISGLPQLDGVRSERRKYPDLHLRSSIVLESPRPAARTYIIDSFYRNQKRHYCQHNVHSYLDDYY